MGAQLKWPPNRTIPLVDLQNLVLERLSDGHVLLTAGRPTGAVYLAGYALELALKARICRVLGWAGFPETSSDFPFQLRNFQTHDLAVLLILSGAEADVKSAHFADWSIVQDWNPEMRYSSGSTRAVPDPQAFLDAIARLVPHLL